MKKPEIRPATEADITTYFGHLPKETMRALVAVLDGQPIAISGVVRRDGLLMLFSESKPEMRKYRKHLVKAGRMIMEKFSGLPLRAVADPNIKNSGRFLERLGFHHIGACPDGEVYEWN